MNEKVKRLIEKNTGHTVDEVEVNLEKLSWKGEDVGPQIFIRYKGATICWNTKGFWVGILEFKVIPVTGPHTLAEHIRGLENLWEICRSMLAGKTPGKFIARAKELS
ncbi:hypothetical protein LCGC14_0620630 [marine sediment metagenome]|uniref:Uncharacterized protein n=1 Tax=marine sediment metagenome TaxID=412755 RepID=A0A0F9R4Y3_9ZZZZ